MNLNDKSVKIAGKTYRIIMIFFEMLKLMSLKLDDIYKWPFLQDSLHFL